MSKYKLFLNTIFIFVYDFQYLGSTVTLWYIRSNKNLLRVIEKYIILWTVPFNYKIILRMIAIESIHLLSNLKYVGIFDYKEVTVRIRTIYKRIVYFLKGI